MKNRLNSKTSHFTPPERVALPILLATISCVVSLVLVIINSFWRPVTDSLLSLAVAQILAFLVPCYLFVLLSLQDKPLKDQFKEMGLVSFDLSSIFFIIFASLFMMCASILLEILLGGTYLLSDGFTLMGAFTAGDNEFSSSLPYLILLYVVIPSVLEELLLRGIMFNQVRRVNFVLGIIVSAFVSAILEFSLGGFVPAFFCGVMFAWIFYTTSSLFSCMIVHFLFNLYRLLLECNIAAYFHSVNNNILLISMLLVALLVSGILFFGESAKLYRQKALDVYEKRKPTMNASLSLKELACDIKRILAFTPSLICFIITLAAYVTVIMLRSIA